MKAVRLAELRTLIGTPAFRAFWDELQAARAAAGKAVRDHEDALTQAMVADFRAELAQKNGIDTLYTAGEAEDAAARLMAESSSLENRGLDLVGAYEEQRYVASECWYRLNAAERALEERREAAAVAAAQRDPTAAKIETELARLTRAQAEAKEAYEREQGKKQELWEEVEKQWARSTELDLLVQEKRVDARRIKREAERLFRDAESRKVGAREEHDHVDRLARSRTDAAQAVEMLLRAALDRFGGVATQSFMYFRCAENPKLAYAVALLPDGETFNVEVAELQIYRVDRERGVSFLEPAVDAPPEDGDRRFEAWFLGGRKGRVREETQPASEAG